MDSVSELTRAIGSDQKSAAEIVEDLVQELQARSSLKSQLNSSPPTQEDNAEEDELESNEISGQEPETQENAISNDEENCGGKKDEVKRKKLSSGSSTKKRKRHKNKHRKKQKSKTGYESDDKKPKHKKSRKRSKSLSSSGDEIVEWVELEVRPQKPTVNTLPEPPNTFPETVVNTLPDPSVNTLPDPSVNPLTEPSVNTVTKPEFTVSPEPTTVEPATETNPEPTVVPKTPEKQPEIKKIKESPSDDTDKKDVLDSKVSSDKDRSRETRKRSRREDGEKERRNSSGHREDRAKKRDERHTERSRTDRRETRRYSPVPSRSRRQYGSRGRSRSRSRSGSRKRDYTSSYGDRRIGYGSRRHPGTKRDRSLERITSIVNKQAEEIEKKLMADKLLITTVKKPEGFIFTAAESKTRPGEALPILELSRSSSKNVDSGSESKPTDSEDSAMKGKTAAVVADKQPSFDLRQKLLNMAKPKTTLEQDATWRRQQQPQWPPVAAAGVPQYWGYGVPPTTPEAAWAAYNAYCANGTMGQKPVWDPSWYGAAAGANWYNWGWGDAGASTAGGPSAETLAAYPEAQVPPHTGTAPYYWDGVVWRKNPHAAGQGAAAEESESDPENDGALRPPGCESEEETANDGASGAAVTAEEVNEESVDRDREEDEGHGPDTEDGICNAEVEPETIAEVAGAEDDVGDVVPADDVTAADLVVPEPEKADIDSSSGEIHDDDSVTVADDLTTERQDVAPATVGIYDVPGDTPIADSDRKDDRAGASEDKGESKEGSPAWKKDEGSKLVSKRSRSRSGSKSRSRRRKRPRPDRGTSKSKSRSRSPSSRRDRDKRPSHGRARKLATNSRRSRSRSRSRRRSHSRTPTASSTVRRSKRDRSRSHSPRDKSRSRSRARRPSRSPAPRERPSARSRRNRRSRSGSGDDRIDKAKLLEIAKRNALTLMAEGKIPPSLLADAKRKPDPALAKASAKSVQELTDFCKHLSKLEKAEEEGQILPKGTSGDDEEDEGKPFINHPFKVRDVKPIVFSGRSMTNKPLNQNSSGEGTEKPQLRLQFPVSSGSQHRQTDNPWTEVVEELKEPPAEEIINTPINIGSVVSERLKAVRKLQENPLDVEALTQIHRVQKQMQRWARSKQLPGQFTGSQAVRILTPEELAGPKHNQAWVKKTFRQMSEMLAANLPDNLKNLEHGMLNTGGNATGRNCIWSGENDLFTRAIPVAGGIGMNLLRKMGWRPGEGLGKNNEGSVEPLKLNIKMDKKGLVSDGELPRKGKSSLAKDVQSGKHPISMLVELCSRQQWDKPDFQLIHDSGPDHKKNFLFKVMINGREYQSAVASLTKKHAKAQAAVASLQALGVLPDNYTSVEI